MKTKLIRCTTDEKTCPSWTVIHFYQEILFLQDYSEAKAKQVCPRLVLIVSSCYPEYPDTRIDFDRIGSRSWSSFERKEEQEEE